MNRWCLTLAVTTGMVVCGGVAVAQESRPEKGARAEASGLRIVAGQRIAAADARRDSLGYTSTPLIDVTQPRADVLIVNMTGMTAVAGISYEDALAEITFDLSQTFTVVDDKRLPRPIRLTMEAQLIGLFRGSREGAGTAMSSNAEAVVTTGGLTATHVGLPGRTHSGKDMVFISERSPAVEAIIAPGEFNLCQKFSMRCSHPRRCLYKNVVMAMFGDAGRLPEWVNLLDPTRDLPKNKDFGFKVVIRVEPAPVAAPAVPSIPAAQPLSIVPSAK